MLKGTGICNKICAGLCLRDRSDHVSSRSLLFTINDTSEWDEHSPLQCRGNSSTSSEQIYQLSPYCMLFDMVLFSNSSCNSFRSICPEDREAGLFPAGLRPRDEARAVPHSDRCIPLHNCRHSGKFIDEALLSRDNWPYSKWSRSGSSRAWENCSMLIWSE